MFLICPRRHANLPAMSDADRLTLPTRNTSPAPSRPGCVTGAASASTTPGRSWRGSWPTSREALGAIRLCRNAETAERRWSANGSRPRRPMMQATAALRWLVFSPAYAANAVLGIGLSSLQRRVAAWPNPPNYLCLTFNSSTIMIGKNKCVFLYLLTTGYPNSISYGLRFTNTLANTAMFRAGVFAKIQALKRPE